MLAKTVIVLVTLRLASGTPSFTESYEYTNVYKCINIKWSSDQLLSGTPGMMALVRTGRT